MPMREPLMTYLSMGAVQADAVFLSSLQRCDELSAGQVRQAVAAVVRAFGRSGCDGRVAQEFGNHPDTAVIRMRWARDVAREAFADWPPGTGPGTMERHLRSLLYMRRLARPGSQVIAGEAPL
jgi:hypothetical protein